MGTASARLGARSWPRLVLRLADRGTGTDRLGLGPVRLGRQPLRRHPRPAPAPGLLALRRGGSVAPPRPGLGTIDSLVVLAALASAVAAGLTAVAGRDLGGPWVGLAAGAGRGRPPRSPGSADRSWPPTPSTWSALLAHHPGVAGPARELARSGSGGRPRTARRLPPVRCSQPSPSWPCWPSIGSDPSDGPPRVSPSSPVPQRSRSGSSPWCSASPGASRAWLRRHPHRDDRCRRSPPRCSTTPPEPAPTSAPSPPTRPWPWHRWRCVALLAGMAARRHPVRGRRRPHRARGLRSDRPPPADWRRGDGLGTSPGPPSSLRRNRPPVPWSRLRPVRQGRLPAWPTCRQR